MKGLLDRIVASRRSPAVQVVASFVVVFVALQLLGNAPNPLLFAALAVVTMCLVSAASADPGPSAGPWAAEDLTHVGERWGSDHLTTALARDLSGPRENPTATVELAIRVHRRIGAILEARVWRTHGVDLRSNPQWARQVLPEDLAEVYLGPPDAGLLRAERLAQLVARMEAW